MSLPWKSLSEETKIDIILSEELRLGNFSVINAWHDNRLELVRAIERRGVIWDLNKRILAEDQLGWVQTSQMDIKRETGWLRIKKGLARLLHTGAEPIKEEHPSCPHCR